MIEDVKGIKSLSRSSNLSENFKSLSTKAKIDKESSPDKTKRQDLASVSHVVENLQDAVSYSSLALKSLERANAESNGKSSEPHLAEKFIPDLEKLRDDIEETVLSLQKSAEQAEITRENMVAAEARLEDVEAAQVHAEKTGSEISTRVEQALGAHTELSPSRISKLLQGL